MSKIMDRMMDLGAVNWSTTPVASLNLWEVEAVRHVRECRCHKCAVFFARLSPLALDQTDACAIRKDIIHRLRSILASLQKL